MTDFRLAEWGARERRLKIYARLLRVRPTQLGALLRFCFRIHRRPVRSRTGHVFFVDPVSIFGVQLLRDGVYEPEMTRLVNLLLRTGDTFVDVGGHEGYFSVLAASLTHGGPVHYVEPQERLVKVLRVNLGLNETEDVTVHQVALADQDTTARLFLRPSTHAGASSLFRWWRVGWRWTEVPVTTLDDLCERHGVVHIRLLKIDCEGAEPLVIAGGRHVLGRQAVDAVALEYHPAICGRGSCLSAHRELLDAGYVLSKVQQHCVYHLPALEHRLASLGTVRVNCKWDD